MADGFEEEEQPVTIGEYIEGIEAEELEADLVLGGDDGDECTYNTAGYAKRQAIFSCITCVPSGNAGVCVACSLVCHDGHEIVELWTKRRFRCDCGNSKFADFSCKLCPDKDPDNLENSYNHNFRGAYCTCGRPYPDPDVKDQIEMIQCCICEDWFHEEHLGLSPVDKIPKDEEGEPLYEDFICQNCAVICSFVRLYPNAIGTAVERNGAPKLSSTSSISNAQEHSPVTLGSLEPNENWSFGAQFVADASKDVPACESMNVRNSSQHDENVQNKAIEEASNTDPIEGKSACDCKLSLDVDVASVRSENSGPLFLAKDWRQLLCRCDRCMHFYDQRGVSFLVDKEDSIEEYEKIAKQKRERKLQQQEGAEATFFNSLNHVQKIEIASAVADMKNEFSSFLETYDPSRPVTSEDVRAIFENLAKKRQRLS